MDDITRHLGLREHFAGIGDWGLVAEVDAWLARRGVTVPAAVPPIEETAVPRKERARKVSV